MQIEAFLGITDIRVHVLARSYEQANQVRKAVTASKYQGRESTLVKGRWVFSYPMSVEKCWEMREAWGNDLRVHKLLGAWYRNAYAERVAQVKRTAQTDAELPMVAMQYPKLNAWLKGDQRVTASWIANAYRNGGLLADETGTGKTAGVVAGLIEAGINGPTLIVCPKISVKAVWLKELTDHTEVPVYACHGTRKAREKTIAAFRADPTPFKVLVVVAEMLRINAARAGGRVTDFYGYQYPDIQEVTWHALVIDESHKVLGHMDVVKANLAGEGIKDLKTVNVPLRLAVSATPFGRGGKTEALFGTLHWLWPDEFTSRWQWLGKYFEVSEEQVYVRGGGGATKPVKRVGDLLNEAKLWEDLGARVLRRRLEDVSPEHKGLKHFYEMACEMVGPQLAQYRAFAKDAELAVEGGIISTVGTLDYLTRCRQFANGALRKEGGRVSYTGFSAKIDRLMAHLDNMAPGRKVVVASQYNEFLDAVEHRLEEHSWASYRLDGKTSEKRRQDIMTSFQGEGGPQIFLLNTQAGGVSITLDAAEELHALDEMDADSMTQLFGRIFRRGRVHEVLFFLYRSIGTVDEEIGYKVAGVQEKQARLLDGRRGLEYAKEIAQYKGDK